MKEMKYQKTRTFNILAYGTYQGFPYWVVSLGTHPTAYINVTSIKEKLEDNPRLPCHGGITYDEDSLDNVWDEAFPGFVKGQSRFIGWDYAHIGDHVESPLGPINQGGREYTTEYIEDEVKEVIDEIVNRY